VGSYNDIEAIVEENAKLRRDNLALTQSALRVIGINERLGEIIKEMVDRPSAVEAVRFLAELKELDPPHYVHMLQAIFVLRDSQDVESVRLAAKAMLRNLQRLEEKLDDAKAELAASISSEREQ
jgi:hypothetical protein